MFGHQCVCGHSFASALEATRAFWRPNPSPEPRPSLEPSLEPLLEPSPKPSHDRTIEVSCPSSVGNNELSLFCEVVVKVDEAEDEVEDEVDTNEG